MCNCVCVGVYSACQPQPILTLDRYKAVCSVCIDMQLDFMVCVVFARVIIYFLRHLQMVERQCGGIIRIMKEGKCYLLKTIESAFKQH